MAKPVACCLIPVIACLSSTAAHADTSTVAIEDCLTAAQEIVPGSFVKAEFLDPSAESIPAYEIEVRDAQGREWELMCDARTGRIFEIEQEVDTADDPLFAAKAKVTEAQAIEAALAVYPGTVEEVEFEIESNGAATYEIDVITENGKEYKIEVDAASGELIEMAVERWEIGEEAGERRQ
ncbi:MAG: PepSY domain-containing protein [Thiohalocapsa sp.]